MQNQDGEQNNKISSCVLSRIRVKSVEMMNDTTGFVRLKCKGEGPVFHATGVIPPDVLNLGAFYDMEGFWYGADKSGRKFRFTIISASLPNGTDLVVRFLTHTGFIPGMKRDTALNIADALGPDALTLIKNDPSCLMGIKGVGKGLREKIPSAIVKFESASETYRMLFSMGIEPEGIYDLYRKYGNQTVPNVLNTPYTISNKHSDVFPFVVADRISLKGLLETDSDYKENDATVMLKNMDRFFYDESRTRSGILEALRRFRDDGHTFAYEAHLIRRAVRILAVNPMVIRGGAPDPDALRIEETIRKVLEEMKKESEVICVPDEERSPHIYLPELRRAEERVCARLFELAGAPLPQSAREGVEYEAGRSLNGINFSFEQMEAITSAMSNMFMIITGGPGTGKTTIMAEIVRRHLDRMRSISLAAPTAKAADRMFAVTGTSAVTIQRLIGDRPDLGPMHTVTSPIQADVVIVDEASMIDITIMEKLVNAIAPGTFFIMIGDVDQLPSVGPGSVFSDLIRSGAFEVRRLSRIFRQKKMSSIPELASGILNGRIPDTSSMSDVEICWCSPDELMEKTATRINGILREYEARHVSDAKECVRVITPLRIGESGSCAYSERLRNIYNPVMEMEISDPKVLDTLTGMSSVRPGQNYIEFKGLGRFRVGDTVIQGENCYGMGVMNGEEGVVTSISPLDFSMEITFRRQKKVKYTMDMVKDGKLELSYAVTVHKSQGSEYPDVFIVIPPEAGMMMNRRLLYTAITRARGRVFIYGSYDAMMKALSRNSDGERNSGLAVLLSETAGTDRRASSGTARNCYSVMVNGVPIPLFRSFAPVSFDPQPFSDTQGFNGMMS